MTESSPTKVGTVAAILLSAIAIAAIRHRAIRSARWCKAPSTSQLKQGSRYESLADIHSAFERWKSTTQNPLMTAKSLHPDLPGLIHVTDPAILNNSPPDDFDDLSPQAKQILSGITPSVSTIPGAFLPPRKALLDSFNQVRRFSLLTEGGRAFTKHCHRCSGGWWGSAKGPAAKVNDVALRKVVEILDNATWKNVFYLPGDRPVCEFRVRDGYGARWTWSENPEEICFRGFLEPPQENGHEVGWKH